MTQAISIDDTDDIIYVPFKQYCLTGKGNRQSLPFKQYCLTGKGNRQSLFVPGSIEIGYVRSRQYAHGKAIDLSDKLPDTIDFGLKNKVILLN